MAARPQLQALAQHIESEGGEEAVFDMIADGEPIRAVAERFGTSRRMIYYWFDMRPHKERRRTLLDMARKLAAEARVEKGEDILDRLEEKGAIAPAEVSLAKARSDYQKFLAGSYDRERFGTSKGEVNVNVSVGELHLDAVRRRKVIAEVEPEPERIGDGEVVEAEVEAEVEVIPPEDGDDVLEALQG